MTTKSSFSLYDDDDEDEPVPSKKSREESGNVALSAGDVREASASIDDNAEVKDEKVVASKRVITCSHAALRGERAEMEDAHVCVDDLLPREIAARSSLYAIFDGHAGSRASAYCQQHMASTISQQAKQHKTLEALEKGMKKLLTDTFKITDEGFLKAARVNKPVWKDGTTATALLIVNDVIYSANIGDSKAIVCRRGEKDGEKDVIVELTVDHNPQKFEERQRINKHGGVVKNGRVDGIIEVSRSIGDGQFKNRGVTCIPDIKKFTLTEKDRYVLVACDGLWKSFTNEDAVQFIDKSLEDAKDKEEVVVGGEKAKWQYVASQLTAEAVRRRCGDNVSLLILTVA